MRFESKEVRYALLKPQRNKKKRFSIPKDSIISIFPNGDEGGEHSNYV